MLIADIGRAVQEEFQWCAHFDEGSLQRKAVLQFRLGESPGQSMVGLRHKYGGLFPTDNVLALLLAQYRDLKFMFIGVPTARQRVYYVFLCRVL